MAVQRANKSIHCLAQLLSILPAEYNAVCLDESMLGGRDFSLLVRIHSHDGVEKGHDGFTSRAKGDRHAQCLFVEEQLLQSIWSGKNCQVVVEPSGGRSLIRRLLIPTSAHISPDLAVADIVVFNGHPVTPQVPEAFNPRVLKGRHRLIEQGHHRVRQVNERQHVLQTQREIVSEEFEEAVDSVAPHTRRHGVLGCQLAESGTC